MLESGGGDELAESAGFASKVHRVEGFPGNDEEVERSGVHCPGRSKNETSKAGDQTDGGQAEGIYDRIDGEEALDAIKSERTTVPPSVPIEGGDEEEGGSKSKGIKSQHAVDLDGGGKAGSPA